MNLKSLCSLLIAGLLSVSANLVSAGTPPPPRAAKATALFDGKTLEGWESPTPRLWSVTDGCLTGGDGNKIPYNDFLCTKASYANFILHLKIKLTGDPKTGMINSGIQIRTQRNPAGHEVCGYQCDYGEPEWYAAIYDEGRRNRLMAKSDMAALRPVLHANDWNDYVIKADGGHIQTWINGVQGVDYHEADPDIASDGILGIQVHGGGNTKVQVKDVFIEELPVTPRAPTWKSLGGVDGQRAKLKPGPKAAYAAPKTVELFDGKSLTGWDGDAKYWRAADGAITGEIPEGAAVRDSPFIFWRGQVNDFDFAMEYRISGDASANAGIQYRSARLADGAAKGYRADLDDGGVWLGRIYDEPQRALLVERGSRVSIAPDGRRWNDGFADPKSFGGLAKKGEWNHCRITAAASHVEVRVNEVLVSVLDDHEAKEAAFSGLLAFQLRAGKGPAKIQFRNIRLTHLGKTARPDYADVKAAPKFADAAGIKPMGDDRKPLNLDFETGTLIGWKVEGDAWEKQPVEGDTVAVRKRGNSRHEGKFWLGGYERGGDKGTGTLTSASFVVTHPWASFLIGGGRDPKQTRVEVVEEAGGKVIHAASGHEREDMQRVAVDLEGMMGKRIFVRIIDNSTKGWGHVNFDDFVFHDQAPMIAAVASNSTEGGDREKHGSESPVLWHLVPNPAKPTAIANADAQKAVAGMRLTQGFQAQLIAAEPTVKQPIAFCMDDRGRLWIAEAYSYPNKQPEGKGQDRIIILEDRDGDGIFETRRVFMEGLNLVSGIEVGFGGVWIGAAPELLYIPCDKDDHAGKPQTLLDGWGYQDTHETINSFTWGPDGWLYGNQGVFTKSLVGKPGTPEAGRTELHSGVWRYHPVRHEFEIFAHGGSNQWGLDFNSNGHFFMTHCRSFWGRGGTTNVIRNGHFWNQANSGYAPFISATAPSFAPELQNYLPAAARYDSGEGGAGKPGTTAVYGGHSHVGTMIYLGDNWPEIYRDHLFTHNLHGHQMNQQINVRTGSAYETLHAGYDLMFAPDPRYIAVDLQTGPDGAVYVIDWCDTQHCHNPAAEKWDRSNGRVYRISWAQTYQPVKVNLGGKSDLELAQLHTHTNDWFSRTARRLLQERAALRQIAPEAIALLRTQAAGADTAHVLRALWTLHVIGALDSAQRVKFASHGSDVVRAWAVQLATEHAGEPLLSGEVLAGLAKSDPSPVVRLALASALPMLPSAEVWDIATALAGKGQDRDDRFLPKMIWFGLAPAAAEDWARSLELAETTALPTLADSIRWSAARTPKGRDLMAARIANQKDEKSAARGVQLLAFAMKDEAGGAVPSGWNAVYARFENTKDASIRSAADRLAALFGNQTVLDKMRRTLADSAAPLPERQFAFDLLKRGNDAGATAIFAGLLDSDAFRSPVIPLLSRSNDPGTSEALMVHFEKLDASDRSAALGAMTSRPALALPLLKAVQSGKFERKYLSALQIRQMRNLHDAEVDRMLDQTWGKVNESSAAAKATVARLKKAYTAAPLWAYNGNAGRETFVQVCGVCHALSGSGGRLGPDLTGSWRNGLDYFLENIVDPNAVVGDNFQLHLLTKKDGTVISGLIEQETATALTLRTVTESVIVAKADLKEHQKLAQSLMPPGLLEALPEQKVFELLKFLLSKQE